MVLTRKERLEAINQKKLELAKKYYHGRCFICHRILTKKITFHHLKYIPGEKTYRDFPNISGKGYDSIAYNEYLLPLVELHPKLFLCLDSDHHQSLEKLKRWGETNLRRLLKARKMSKCF